MSYEYSDPTRESDEHALPPLSPAMRHAIEFSRYYDGYLGAGNDIDDRGRLVRINARTIDALISRGLAVRCFSASGGVGCRVTTDALAAAREGVES